MISMITQKEAEQLKKKIRGEIKEHQKRKIKQVEKSLIEAENTHKRIEERAFEFGKAVGLASDIQPDITSKKKRDVLRKRAKMLEEEFGVRLAMA